MRKRIAVITGASSGFGKIFAGMADEQFQVIDEYWLIGRDVERLIEVSNELRHRSKILPFDLTSMEALKKIKQIYREEKPVIKMLVNAAGFGITGAVEGQTEEQLAKMIDVNCRALTWMTRISLPYMKKNSRIVNFASVAGFMPQPHFAVYAATKSYVLSFSRALNCELKKRRIYVTAVCPGPAKTRFFSRAEESGEKAGSYKDMFMVEPEPVVKKALRDAMMGKEISVYSLPMKALHVLTKVIPRRMIFRFL